MGRKCCVFGCTSNYNNESQYTTVFKFPTASERRQKWIKCINREDFNPSSSAVVCIKHFEDRFIIKEDSVTRDDGSVLVCPRVRPALTKEAFPTKFPNQPAYLSQTLPSERKSPAVRRQEMLHRDEENFIEWCAADKISSFEEFASKCSEKLSTEWTFVLRSEFAGFYKIEDKNCPTIEISFKVFKDLSVLVFTKETCISMQTYNWLLGADNKCDRWTKFESLISHLSSAATSFSFEQTISQILLLFNKATNYPLSDDINQKLKFLIEQVTLLVMKKPRYTSEQILWSAKIFFTYPAAYNLIRDSEVLTLPHPCYLKKLYCKKGYYEKYHIDYLTKKSNLLKDYEKTVNLLLDEIYVNPMVTYKAGRLVGISENSNAEATTMLVFMLSSILSKSKDVVALFPVKNLTADLLYDYTYEVLKTVTNCNFTVLCMISDNNRVNRNMFTRFCGGTLKPSIPHPLCPDKKLFFLFDSVHLIKSIRNNWLNQALTSQVLYFPNIIDDRICCANLKDLIDIHEFEKNSILKVAPKLSQKVLFPTNIERQNVRLALNLFHDTNSVALDTFKDKLSEYVLDTKLFIDYILKWWKIMNLKQPFVGERCLDSRLLPLKSVDDENFIFLIKFAEWIKKWNDISLKKAVDKKLLGFPGRGGTLSRETFCALEQTTIAAIEIVKYLFDVYGVSYVLLGKFQTDSLEARFGQYRQMSGGNYNISCQQIFESEKKLKILSMISLFSGSQGKFFLKNLDFQFQEHQEYCKIPKRFYNALNSNVSNVNENTMSVLIYIAGYVAKKVSFMISCTICISRLIIDKSLSIECNESYDFLKATDRGSLKWPQKFLISIVLDAYLIFQNLISETYEIHFNKHPNQKELLIQLVIEKMEYLGESMDSKCDCGLDDLHLVKKCLSGVANIFHNNYVKLRNDKRNTNTNLKRKLSTLTNT